jgi:hypothetical protein
MPRVDFAKSGSSCGLVLINIVAGVAAILDPKLRPKEWPDFMDKVSSLIAGVKTKLTEIRTKRRRYMKARASWAYYSVSCASSSAGT